MIEHVVEGAHLAHIPARDVLVEDGRVLEHACHVGDVGSRPASVSLRHGLVVDVRAGEHVLHGCGRGGVPGPDRMVEAVGLVEHRVEVVNLRGSPLVERLVEGLRVAEHRRQL